MLSEIFTANTYFWTPGRNAATRRANEHRQHAKFQQWLAEFGDMLAAAGIEVEFHYEESCRHVYKRVIVTRNGKRSNLSVVKRLLNITE